MKKTPLSVNIVGYLIVLISIVYLIGALADLIEYGYYGGNGWEEEENLHMFAWVRTFGWGLNTVVGYKILMGKSWARFLYIALALVGLGVVVFMAQEPQSIISQAIAVTVVSFCLFNRSAQGYFATPHVTL
jgi:hypothetical protein